MRLPCVALAGHQAVGQGCHSIMSLALSVPLSWVQSRSKYTCALIRVLGEVDCSSVPKSQDEATCINESLLQGRAEPEPSLPQL